MTTRYRITITDTVEVTALTPALAVEHAVQTDRRGGTVVRVEVLIPQDPIIQSVPARDWDPNYIFASEGEA